MKTILIPFDLSGHGCRALQYALDLFRGQRIKCVLLNIYDPSFRSTELELAALTNKFCRDLQRKVWQEVDGVIKNQSNVNAVLEVRIEVGDWTRQIVNYTGLHPVDYVVLGKPRTTWFDRLLGSKISDMVRRSSRPVVIVPERFSPAKPVKIAFVADFKLLRSGERLAALRSLATEWGAEVAIWSLVHREKEIIETLQSRRLEEILGQRLGPLTFLDANYSLESILSVIAQDPVDLLVTPHYRGSLFDRLFLKSLAKELAMQVEIPLLTLPVRQPGVGWDARWSNPQGMERGQGTDRRNSAI